ncbi:conserved hypothetical protein [Magnetospirillum sp. LM-5]|uniref:N-formylglutamate amidohydrolase n=1 Tax=Magnetospirillum sp. LM-5 TaxID=2681466 RepID=UPI00138055E6|nr:N-formylglutamate amidohydrolase [Magnetospirillum sp. LM-5]CAA7622457.1 conserved hypothetical protein [Magnetospirillum sp. LM-5]
MLRFLPPGPDNPSPFVRIDGQSDADIVVVCDHASAVIPARLADLGLSAAGRLAHVAWDIGAAQVSQALARRLGCPAILAGVSRLVIDCNRQPGDPSSIPASTCGVPVPGNQGLAEAEAHSRADQWFWPYHREIGDELARQFRRGRVPAMISIHSFTPTMHGVARPWHAGVLSNRDRRMADPVLAALAGDPTLVVGDNQPYSGREINYTLDTHAGAAGLPHVSFEIRQDLLADDNACQAWADRLAGVLAPVLADPGIRRVELF